MDDTKSLRMLGLSEVAGLLHRDPVTIRRWVKKGTFLPARIDGGGREYWLEDELADFVRREPSTQRPPPQVHVEPIVSSRRKVRR